MAKTGIETSDIIKSVVDKIKIDFVIAIDALSSSSIERVNKTIQIKILIIILIQTKNKITDTINWIRTKFISSSAN